MGKKTDVGLPSFLKDIIAIAESGEFDLSHLTGHPNAERGDVVIGEMTPFEKAVVMVSERFMNEHNNLVRAHEEHGEQVDEAKLKRMKPAHEVFSRLLRASLYGRLDAEYLGENWAGFALLEGGQIAAIPDLARKHLLAISRDLEGLLGTLRAEGHDCAHCPAHDDCDSPAKKPR